MRGALSFTLVFQRQGEMKTFKLFFRAAEPRCTDCNSAKLCCRLAPCPKQAVLMLLSAAISSYTNIQNDCTNFSLISQTYTPISSKYQRLIRSTRHIYTNKYIDIHIFRSSGMYNISLGRNTSTNSECAILISVHNDTR